MPMGTKRNTREVFYRNMLKMPCYKLRMIWNRASWKQKGLMSCLVTILVIWSAVRLSIWVTLTVKLMEWNIDRWECMDFFDLSPYTRGPVPAPADVYISHNFHPYVGLGNKMSIYAAMWGIARRNNLTIAIPRNVLHDSLHVDLKTVGRFDLSDCRNLIFGIPEPSVYDPRVDEPLFRSSPRRNVSLWSYLQSWKYFHPLYRDEIRRQFLFRTEILQRADKARTRVLDQIQKKLLPNETHSRPVIGVHIRRGDILKPYWTDMGMVEMPRSYFDKAERLLESKDIIDAVYLVCTNDPEWAEENLPFRLMGVVRDESPEVDMAILAQSDHLILSFGTFSFWAAYLSNAGTVVYFADSPRPDSKLAEVTNLSEFWLPEWIGVGG